ncbi:MAG: 2,3-diketo-5-methylthiopentyl-1-phosphate enolase [Candidatus Firestonebacteria bacterium]
MLDSKIFTIAEEVVREDYVVGLYYMETKTEDILKRVEAIALEQSTGTWVSVPEETEEIREKYVAKVIGVYDVPNYEDALPEDLKERKVFFLLAFPAKNLNGQIPQLLTALYGNISMAGKIKLLDVFLPPSFVGNYKGPKFGIEGIRKLLGIKTRPLLLAMFKPCVGMAPKTLGKLLYELGVGGVDIIKDDELLADPDFCCVEERLEECMKACQKVYKDTGRKVLYALNITDNLDKMMKKAKVAVKNGANCLMVNTYTVQYSTLSALAEDSSINVPLLTHPDFAGALFGSPYYGLSSNLVLGKFARLAGSDIVVYPSYFGKVLMVKERIIRIAQELTCKFYHLKRVFPVPSAGVHPGLVDLMIKDLGNDLIIGAGGGVHGHPLGVIAGAKAFHQAIDAVQQGISLKAMAKKKKELKLALEKWGTPEEKINTYTLVK